MQTNLNKKLWGLLAFSPWILFFTLVPFIQRKSIEAHVVDRAVIPGPYEYWTVIVGNVYCLILVIIFMIYLGKIRTIEKEKKRQWRWLLIFGNVIAIPAFWYFHILKENRSNKEDAPDLKTVR